MKLFFVLMTHINNLPPARNILIELISHNCHFNLITIYSSGLPDEIKNSKFSTIYDIQKEPTNNKIKALLNRFVRRNKLRKIIKQNVSGDDVIWTFTDYDAMEVGKALLKYQHVMQLMELIKDIPYFDEIPFIKANIKRYALKAKLVVVPEYNRAYIQQVYWGLKDTPVVIPNKPNVSKDVISIQKISEEAKKTYEQIKDKKIVLYQGTFGYERKLDVFIKAVHELGKDYCIVLMGNKTSDLDDLIKKYPYIYFVPFIPAPYHLFFTSIAYIGIVTYSQFNNIRHYDPLNAVYCAPNKIYEYSCFGVPMIGNKIPGLETPFNNYECGVCSDMNVASIIEAILNIDNNYQQYSKGALKLYNSFDLWPVLKKILIKLGLD